MDTTRILPAGGPATYVAGRAEKNTFSEDAGPLSGGQAPAARSSQPPAQPRERAARPPAGAQRAAGSSSEPEHGGTSGEATLPDPRPTRVVRVWAVVSGVCRVWGAMVWSVGRGTWGLA